jgi:regulator of protease activity HflC (stomatin/prohibitin superfamily)
VTAASGPAAGEQLPRALSRAMLLILLLGYWLFAWQLEQISYSQGVPGWSRLVTIYPLFDVLTTPVTLAAELLSPRVLRHFLPVIAGYLLAREAVARFLESFYDLADRAAGAQLLSRLTGTGRAGRSVAIRRDRFEADREKEAMLKVGGPGRIGISPGDVVVTEVNGRFSRILGAGGHSLRRFEVPVLVMDVRPQERRTDSAAVVTADGIELQAEVSVTFQIGTGGQRPTSEKPYPYDEQAVRLAAYAETNRGEGTVDHWSALPLAITASCLRDIVAGHPLDELIFAEHSGVHTYRLVRAEMERCAREALREYGIEVIATTLGHLELPEEVRRQRVATWQAHWDGQSRMQIAEGEAKSLEVIEIARAEAEALMLQAIAEGLRRAELGGGQVQSREIMALRTVEALERVARQSQQVTPLPANVLPALANLRQELGPADGGSPPAEGKPA